MSTKRHNSVTPKSVKNFPYGVKLTVHENGKDDAIDTVVIVRFDETRKELLVSPLKEQNEQKVFMYWDNIWHFMFPDPMTDKPVTNSRCSYDLRLSAIK